MTSQNQIEYFVDQLKGAGTVRYRKMFGEYGLYCNEKYFALACDNKLFFKVKDWSDSEIMNTFGNHNAAYPGALNTAEISAELIENTHKLVELTHLVLERLRK